jgi:drug/metabolite transporter (DMT)-like permease
MATAALTAPVLGLVVLAGLLHAGWNAVAHHIPDRRAGLALLAVAYTVVGAPLTVLWPVPPPAAWPWILASVLTHIGYAYCLLGSYRLGDFSHTYPLARAVAPLVVVAVGSTCLHQRLAPHGWWGLGMLCGGILLVALGRPSGGRRWGAATSAALATGVFIASYTLIDGVGVQQVPDAVSYVVWVFALQGPLTVAALAATGGARRLAADCRPHLALGLASGVVSLLAYGIVIWAQGRAPGNTGTIAATREIGIVFAALIGALVFRERLGVARVVGAGVALAGIAVLDLG